MTTTSQMHYDVASLTTRPRSGGATVTLRLTNYFSPDRLTWDHMQRVRALSEAAGVVITTTRLDDFCTQMQFEQQVPNDDATLTPSIRRFEDVMKGIFNGNILGDSVCLVDVYETSADGTVIDLLYDS